MSVEVQNNYMTSDLSFAAYLKAKGVDIISIEVAHDQLQPQDQPWAKCYFVFRILDNDEHLQKLQEEWNESKQCSEIKRVLHYQKILKKELFEKQQSLKIQN